jgi:hypothetical protein
MLQEATYPTLNRKRISWLVGVFSAGMVTLTFLFCTILAGVKHPR